jgi:hypothetical protein
MDFGKSNAPDAEQITHPCTKTMGPFGWNYKPAEKHCWLIFLREKYCFN